MEDSSFSELSSTDLEDTTGGSWAARAWTAARVGGRWALGPVGGTVIGAGLGAIEGAMDPNNKTWGDTARSAAAGAFHGATFGVFRATPAH